MSYYNFVILVSCIGYCFFSQYLWAFCSVSQRLQRKSRSLTRHQSPTESSCDLFPSKDRCDSLVQRRKVLAVIITGVCSNIPFQSLASTESTTIAPYRKVGKTFSYSFQPPLGFEASTKLLKTHLDEIIFTNSNETGGYQYGITVDPVRIESLQQFGTPEQVAAKIVTAEVNRDGIFEVTLVRDPVEDEDGAYITEYISDGKRGKKHYVTRTIIKDGNLYVLTVQSNEEAFSKERAQEIRNSIRSFQAVI